MKELEDRSPAHSIPVGKPRAEEGCEVGEYTERDSSGSDYFRKHMYIEQAQGGALMLEVSLSGVETVLRLERDAWLMVKRLRQATNKYPPSPRPAPYLCSQPGKKNAERCRRRRCRRRR